MINRIESRSPYQDPLNLTTLRHRIEARREHTQGPLASRMETAQLDKWLGFIRTALTTLNGEGILRQEGTEYIVEFGGKEEKDRLTFDPVRQTVRHSSFDNVGETRIDMPHVAKVAAFGESTLTVTGGERQQMRLLVGTRGNVEFTIHQPLTSPQGSIQQ